MADAAQYRASCSCGALTLSASAPPAFSAVCCCTHCQSRTGSAFGLSAYFAETDVVDRTGTPTVYTRISEKGRPIDYRFCPVCGVTVWWEAAFLPGKIGVAGGILEGPTPFHPDGAYFCATKPGFVAFDAALPQAQGATTG